ncbi:uncharacterized protein LOC117647990 [Thrips palmi]|uniref:Uncharacterized protein LOC117647990 n=1 Tax=Thrips palmi TaxID=161013 RepID=A0A6P8ZQI7_THRPL|nr:uncharacterized protein LOC117647990 [Thrips palmi]
MLFHVPEVHDFLVNDKEHRNGCRSLLCCSCALFRQLTDVLANRCTVPTFFLDWWKRMCIKMPREKQRSSHEFLFRLITTLRLEHSKRMGLGLNSNMSLWETVSSKLFGGKQLVRVRCNQCNPADLNQEFLSVEIQLQGQNLSGEIEQKLYESKEEFCPLCDAVTFRWKPLSIKMPHYLIVHVSNCSLNAAQAQYVTVCGEDFVLKSCITQTETSSQALFTSISLYGVNKQFEDAQVKKVSQATFARKGIPDNSTMTFLFITTSSSSTLLTSSIETHLEHDRLDTEEVTLNPSSPERQVTVPSRTTDPESLMARISLGKNKGTQTALKVSSCDAETQTNLFDYDRFKLEESDFKSWTGMSVEDFEAFYNLLGGEDVVLKLKQKYRLSTPMKINTTTRISGEDRLLLFFLRFRQGLTLMQLSFLYKLSESYISDLFYVMTCHVYETMKALSEHMFISASKQLKNKPLVMKPFKNLRVILDGVSIGLETPSNFEQQGNTWSTYKHKNVALFIVGISCHGATIFCSEGMEGSMSDKVATLKSNLQDLLDEGDCIMVDKGFELQSDMAKIGCKILRPPFKERGRFFTKEELDLTQAIAAARIYVEHAMADIKDNRIFRGDIPLTLIPILSKLVFSAAFMRNFSPTRICNVSFRPEVTKEQPVEVQESSEQVDDPHALF